MPKYDYQCSSCGATLEADQRISDPPLTTCEACGEDSLQRLIGGGVGVIMKGSSSSTPPPNCQSCPSSESGSCPYSR
jgi:putative FmdB family regulatory protein